MFSLNTIRDALRTLYSKLCSLNFYTATSTDDHERQTGIISTRIAIILLTGSLLSLTLYSGLVSNSEIITVTQPTVDQYKSFIKQHPDMTCTCTNIAISYSSFIEFQPRYHQFCTSDFTLDVWLTFLSALANEAGGLNDWRRISFAQFRLMVALCDLAETTTTDAIDSFLETRLVVSQLSDESLFLSQIQVIVESFQADTQTAFGREIDVIDVLKQGNLLVSSLGTSNYFTAFYDYYYRDFPVYSTSEQFLDQNDAWENCQVSSKGTNLVAATDTQNIAHWIPGWRFGCYIDEALFASTLECYYNITCLSLLRNVYSLPLEVQVLKVTNDSRFAVDTTIGTIVRQLFIEDLAATFNFTGYFMACLPSQCIYTIVERRSIITVITTVVGLLGGLTKAIDLVVPRAVRFIRRHGHKWKRIIKVKPKINTNTTVTC